VGEALSLALIDEALEELGHFEEVPELQIVCVTFALFDGEKVTLGDADTEREPDADALIEKMLLVADTVAEPDTVTLLGAVTVTLDEGDREEVTEDDTDTREVLETLTDRFGDALTLTLRQDDGDPLLDPDIVSPEIEKYAEAEFTTLRLVEGDFDSLGDTDAHALTEADPLIDAILSVADALTEKEERGEGVTEREIHDVADSVFVTLAERDTDTEDVPDRVTAPDPLILVVIVTLRVTLADAESVAKDAVAVTEGDDDVDVETDGELDRVKILAEAVPLELKHSVGLGVELPETDGELDSVRLAVTVTETSGDRLDVAETDDVRHSVGLPLAELDTDLVRVPEPDEDAETDIVAMLAVADAVDDLHRVGDADDVVDTDDVREGEPEADGDADSV
jgi:hypothetical protein